MKLTNKHISDFGLQTLIEYFDCWPKSDDSPWPMDKWIMRVLLELKEWREKDRKQDPICQALNEGDGVYRP